ncbi:MAG TPA: hypothetical protein VFV86_10970 [Nitrososphaeraceae archaeon]|nr:hypothetical protein [Nitrososphaeraceae archaeon]
MVSLKKYPNFSDRKTKELTIIFIISIIVISYGLFFYLQSNTERDIRNSLFEQQKQRQIESALAISQHIGSDLDSIMTRDFRIYQTQHIYKKTIYSAIQPKNQCNKCMVKWLILLK